MAGPVDLEFHSTAELHLASVEHWHCASHVELEEQVHLAEATRNNFKQLHSN